MKYKIKEDLLEPWSPELAYFLGIIITDGEVKNTGVFIDLEEGDREVLVHLRDVWSPGRTINGPYEKKEGTRYCRLALTSPTFAKKIMEKYHILPRKTGSEHIDFDIPNLYLPHFLRGVFDGDGFVSLRMTKEGRRKWEAGFVSPSKLLLEQIKSLYGGNQGRNVRLKTDARKTKNGTPRRAMYAWEFGIAEGVKLRDMMYVEGYFGMTRKWEKFKQFVLV